MSGPEGEPLLDIARGDAARSKTLRAALQVLRDKSGDPEFRKICDDVLSGRRGLREAARDPVFNQSVADRAAAGARWFQGLSEEERERLAAQGKQQAERLRQEDDPRSDGQEGLDSEDESGFDPSDPLNRRQDAHGATPSRWTDSESGNGNDDDYEFDPDDPLQRGY